MPTPDVGGGDFGAVLLAVDAISATNVWAVGGYNDGGDSLIMHWDGGQWSAVAHPTPGTYHRLYGVAASGPNDVWAVGEISTDGGITRTHVLRYNGAAWSVVTSPIGPSGGYNRLEGVTAVAANDVWAVGADGPRALALRWNGTKWSVVNTPAPPQGTTYELSSVSAVAANDVWAVGDGGADPLAMHWNGAAWAAVPTPAGAAIEEFDGVTALAPGDVWAVGHDGNTFAAHWNGSAWAVVSTPDLDDPNFLRGVDALAANNVVAVGEGDFSTLVERWNGQQWVIEPSADQGTGFNQLFGVHAGAPNDVWTVGTVDGETLTQHRNGSSFMSVPSPSVAGRDNVLEDVDGVSPQIVWAVGHHDDPSFIGSRTLILRWNGAAWTVVPSPSPGKPTDRNNLLAVAAVSPTDVWAVGAFVTESTSKALILRWNGVQWRSVKNRCGRGLEGITAFSATDVWAIGGVTSCHWNGTTWTPVPVAPPVDQSFVDLRDVDGASTDDLWAVGSKAFQCGEGVCFSSAVQHWDGDRWTDVPAGAPPLTGVDALAADNVWAVGLAPLPAIWHYDGTSWRAAPEPELADGAPELHAVEGSGPDDIWAAGTLRTGTLFGSSLVLHARSFTSGAVVGDTNVAQAVVSWFGPETGSVATDSFGDYRVGGLTAAAYTFIATAPGCDPASATVQVQAGTTIAANLSLDC